MNALLQQPFFQVTLPIVIAMFATVWALVSTNNRRLDDVRADLKDLRGDLKDMRGEFSALRREMADGFRQVSETLQIHGGKIALLEERTSPLGRR
jgi:hypothetical protein